MGRHLGPWPAWEPDLDEAPRHIYEEGGQKERWLGTNDWKAASAEARLSVCHVAVSPSSSLDPPLLLNVPLKSKVVTELVVN